MRVAPDINSDDPAVLKQLLAQILRERDAFREQTQDYQEQLEARDAEALDLRMQIEALKLQIAKLKRLKFGQSSEKYDAQIGQLELILEDLETT